MLNGQFLERLRRRTVEDALGQCHKLATGKVSQEPVAGNATFRKGDDLDPVRGGPGNVIADLGEVRVFVRGDMLELDGGDSHVTHQTLSQASGAPRDAGHYTSHKGDDKLRRFGRDTPLMGKEGCAAKRGVRATARIGGVN